MLVQFVAGSVGEWKITRIDAVIGPALDEAPRLAVVAGAAVPPIPGSWSLRGVVSNARYTTRQELAELVAMQKGLGRPKATRGALIPIRKSAAWWALAQDERRALIEDRSRHIAIGLEYLPEIARRLHHGRDLGEWFDFLTWFEFAPEHQARFDHLVQRLRETEEWGYVEHEVDIRLQR